mgnify:CR=1 FL=1
MVLRPLPDRLPHDWPLRSASRRILCAPHDWHVQISGTGPDVLLLHGAGAALGPALAGFAMSQFGARAFPGYLLLLHLAIGIYVVQRVLVRPREAGAEGHFHPMLRTTPTAMELLPEADTPDED